MSGNDDLAASLLARTAGRRTGGTTGGSGKRGGGATRRKGGDTEPQLSGPGPDRRDPMAIAAAVDELVDAQQWREQTRLAAAIARWDDIAGPDLAAHVQAASFEAGVLTLQADSTSWATQLRLLLPTLRAKIDAEVGRGVVADIVVRGPQAPLRRGAWRVPGRGPRDTYG